MYNHLTLLFSILILFFGLGIFAFNIYIYFQSPTKLKKSYLMFIAAFSYQLVLAIVCYYLYINLNLNDKGFLIIASLVFIGMSFLEFTYFNYHKYKNNLKIKKNHLILLIIGITITGIQSFVVILIKNSQYLWISIFVAFIPFIALVIILTTIDLRKSNVFEATKCNKSKMHVFLAIFTIIIAFFEVIYFVYNGVQNSYYIISLPFAFLLTTINSISTIKNISPRQQSLSGNFIEKYNLSKREIEILDLVIKGYSNKEISFNLNISVNTVRNHIYNSFQKMNIQKRMDLLSILT